jgi:hypothetical protein
MEKNQAASIVILDWRHVDFILEAHAHVDFILEAHANPHRGGGSVVRSLVGPQSSKSTTAGVGHQLLLCCRVEGHGHPPRRAAAGSGVGVESQLPALAPGLEKKNDIFLFS